VTAAEADDAGLGAVASAGLAFFEVCCTGADALLIGAGACDWGVLFVATGALFVAGLAAGFLTADGAGFATGAALAGIDLTGAFAGADFTGAGFLAGAAFFAAGAGFLAGAAFFATGFGAGFFAGAAFFAAGFFAAGFTTFFATGFFAAGFFAGAAFVGFFAALAAFFAGFFAATSGASSFP
jgi:hypothetical protein